MSLKASELSKVVECSNCNEISTQQMYQCEKGHTICGNCTSTVNVCPECHIQLKVSGSFLKNRVAESLVALLKVPCPFKLDGCDQSFQRENLEDHTQECKYRGNSIQLCRRLGYNCEFYTNTSRSEDALAHFSGHGTIDCTGNHVFIKLIQFASTLANFNGTSTLGRWEPIMLTTSDQSKFLILVTVNCKKHGHYLNFKCILMENANEDRTYEAEFSIRSPNTRVLALTWKQDALPATSFKCLSFSLNIPALLISDFFMDRTGNVGVDVHMHSDHLSKALPTIETISLTKVLPLNDQMVELSAEAAFQGNKLF